LYNNVKLFDLNIFDKYNISMTIKYGELTIIYNQEETMLTSFLNWFNNKDISPKYVFLFDDGEICEYGDKNRDLKFIFCKKYSSSEMPSFFKKEMKTTRYHNPTYFYKEPKEYDNMYNCLVDFDPLFRSYSKYDCRMIMKSNYNCIYYCHKDNSKPEIFSIITIKSSACMPRFQFAYESDEFTKDEIICLIYDIFNYYI